LKSEFTQSMLICDLYNVEMTIRDNIFADRKNHELVKYLREAGKTKSLEGMSEFADDIRNGIKKSNQYRGLSALLHEIEVKQNWEKKKNTKKRNNLIFVLTTN